MVHRNNWNIWMRWQPRNNWMQTESSEMSLALRKDKLARDERARKNTWAEEKEYDQHRILELGPPEKRKGWRKSLLTDRGDRNSPFHQAGTEGTVYIPTWFTCSQEPPWFTGSAKSRKGGLNQWNLILRKQRASRQWDWMRAREQSEPKGTENSIFGSQKNLQSANPPA